MKECDKNLIVAKYIIPSQKTSRTKRTSKIFSEITITHAWYRFNGHDTGITTSR